MNIINIEKLNLNKLIVLTGRPNNVRKIAKHLKARLYILPSNEDYFEDYPDVINGFMEFVINEKGIVIVTSQSAEFLDCLLESSLDFEMATVRKYDNDDNDTYRLRVTTKEYALENRRAFNYELRK